MWKEIACRLNLDPSKWVLLEQQQWPQLLLQLGATQQEEIEWEFELSNRVFFQSRFLFPNLLIASRQAQYHQYSMLSAQILSTRASLTIEKGLR